MTNKNTRKLRTLNFQKQERYLNNEVNDLTTEVSKLYLARTRKFLEEEQREDIWPITRGCIWP